MLPSTFEVLDNIALQYINKIALAAYEYVSQLVQNTALLQKTYPPVIYFT